MFGHSIKAAGIFADGFFRIPISPATYASIIL